MPPLTLRDQIVVLYWFWRRRRQKRRRAPRQWVSNFLQQRQLQGAYSNLVAEIRENDLERFINFHRMTPQTFDYLLSRVGPLFKHADIRRESLSPGLRLSLTLRYLASGDSMVSLQYLFRVSKSSVSRIIAETCQAIWDVLAAECIGLPTKAERAVIAEDYGNRWNFPNCLGTIDGKHVVVQCFNQTGSQFYNYKRSFSINLMGVCDSKYRFTYVSIGAAGRECDGGVFENTGSGRSLIEGTLPIPEAKRLPGSNVLVPYDFVTTLPARENLLRPFAGANLHASKVIFNYRLSGARRMIENTFGVLASKFRIFRKPIIASLETVEKTARACVVLQNFLRDADLNLQPGHGRYIQPGLVDVEDAEGNIEPGSWRAEGNFEGLRRIRATRSRNPSEMAEAVRDMYVRYFLMEGRVPFQWRKLPAREREFYSQ